MRKGFNSKKFAPPSIVPNIRNRAQMCCVRSSQTLPKQSARQGIRRLEEKLPRHSISIASGIPGPANQVDTSFAGLEMDFGDSALKGTNDGTLSMGREIGAAR